MTTTARLDITRAIAILIFITASAILVTPTFAQDATTGATTRREAVKERVETRRENIESKIAALKERVASREATLRAKLQTFKDKRKAEVADRVNTNLNKINENQTTQMQRHLDKMSELLAKLETRVNSNSPDIKDPLAAKAAIANARASIATASSAVSEQSQKDYTMTVTSESQVKLDAQKMRDNLKTDITTVRKLVIEAKHSVGEAIRIAKGNIKEATSSGQQ